MDLREHISCRAEICGGDPVFRETRIPIYIVLDLLEGGIGITEIITRYYPQLSEESIKAAVHYASEIIKRSEFVPFNPVEA